MDFLGIGPLELIGIFLILFIVMGPGDLVKMGATFGRTLRNLRQSDTWKAVQQATRELRTLPESLARQANIEDLDELKKELKQDLAGPSADIEELDRQFVAWTRQESADSDKKGKSTDGKDEEGKGT
jgi:Sec-independent protein translocase protein TatA